MTHSALLPLLEALPAPALAALRAQPGPGWLWLKAGDGIWPPRRVVDACPAGVVINDRLAFLADAPRGLPYAWFWLPADPTAILRAMLGVIPERTPSRHDALVVVFTDCWHARVVVRLGSRLVDGKGSGVNAHEAALIAVARFWDNLQAPAPPPDPPDPGDIEQRAA